MFGEGSETGARRPQQGFGTNVRKLGGNPNTNRGVGTVTLSGAPTTPSTAAPATADPYAGTSDYIGQAELGRRHSAGMQGRGFQHQKDMFGLTSGHDKDMFGLQSGLAKDLQGSDIANQQWLAQGGWDHNTAMQDTMLAHLAEQAGLGRTHDKDMFGLQSGFMGEQAGLDREHDLSRMNLASQLYGNDMGVRVNAIKNIMAGLTGLGGVFGGGQ